MTKKIRLDIKSFSGRDFHEAWMIVPKPVTDWNTRCVSVQFENILEVREVEAINSLQHAFLIKVSVDQIPIVNFEFYEDEDVEADPWIWFTQDNKYTRASSDLCERTKEITKQACSDIDRVHLIIKHAAELFGYAHPEVRFNEGYEEVPILCGTTKGSCVDINTYILAASRCLGIKVQYIAGYWFHPEKTETLDMHCWLAFECDQRTIFWDLAHHLKWGVENLAPGLNPAGGRRVPMTCGRGLRFPTPHGEISISHFSEPLWLLPSGEYIKPDMRITIQE